MMGRRSWQAGAIGTAALFYFAHFQKINE